MNTLNQNSIDYENSEQSKWNKIEDYYIKSYKWEDWKTTFTLYHAGVNKTLIANGKAKKILILDYNGQSINIDYKSNDIPEGAKDMLKKNIDAYKSKHDEEVKSIKQKEAEKLNKDKAKPNELEKKNIEDTPNNKPLKDNLKQEKDINKKQILDNKPKLVIKIPKPFAMGYFIINLSALLSGLLGILSSFLLGLIMYKIADLLKSALSYAMNSKSKINASEINKALNSINLSNVIQEAIDEENIMNLNTTLKNAGLTSDLSVSKTPSEIFYDTTSNLDSSGTYANDNVDVVLEKTID
jgi:hypothetical protein